MPCHNPINAWKSRDLDHVNTKNGKTRLVFRADQGLKSTHLLIPCGQCAGCRLDKARDWAIRCVHEAQMHKENCFVTLTYSDENLPEQSSLRPRDMVLFLKRLRKSIEPKKVRFFQCGEYGDISARPHHHILLFGVDFPDKLLIRSSSQHPLYSSETLSGLWPHGFASIGALTFDSACYVARYILKKITGPMAQEHYGGRKPEYITMSRRPGIGRQFFDLYTADLYNHDQVVVRDGFLAKPPPYYDAIYEGIDPLHFQKIKSERRKKALLNPDNTDERRATKAEIAKLKQAKIPRHYEESQN